MRFLLKSTGNSKGMCHHSAGLTISPVVNIVFVHVVRPYVCMYSEQSLLSLQSLQTIITTSRDCGSASWIKTQYWIRGLDLFSLSHTHTHTSSRITYTKHSFYLSDIHMHTFIIFFTNGCPKAFSFPAFLKFTAESLWSGDFFDDFRVFKVFFLGSFKVLSQFFTGSNFSRGFYRRQFQIQPELPETLKKNLKK